MLSLKAQDKPTAPSRGLQFIIEPEPWLRIFARNLADLFRASPPPVWVTAKPAEYWPDALVHRPVAWAAARQSFLGHVLVALSIYALNLAWLNRPQLLPETPRSSPLRYQLSEYLPAVAPNNTRPRPPRRARPHKADPEYAVQEIIVTRESHISTKQTIVHPNPYLLKQDVPMPNLIVSAPVPAAPLAMNHPLQVLPVNVPDIAPPPQPVTPSRLRPLNFPPAAQPTVAAPTGSAATTHRRIQTTLIEDPVVVPPAPETAARNPRRLDLPPQAPPEVAAPSFEIATNRPPPSSPMPLAAPEVAPPASAPSTARNLSTLGLPSPEHMAVPPAQPISHGGSARQKELGQLLVLNARPIAPIGPVTVPEGNRPGEFAAGPEGRPGATARPEIKAGNDPSAVDRKTGGSGPSQIYVSPPPANITANAVVAAPAAPPAAKPLMPDKTEGAPRDRIDTQVFGTRKHYSMKLSMPNLSSSVGSWTVRFAALNPSSVETGLSAPEAITKVDPAYPQELIHDRVEGTVILRAIIRRDGSVDQVSVLEGFDERLNENARKALLQWRFRPGTRDGVPIDIEAVVRVPFKVRRTPF